MTYEELRPTIEAAASRYGLSPATIAAIIEIESNWQNVQNAGGYDAWGLMQVVSNHTFADRPSPERLLDPAVNIDWGCRILAGNLKQAGGDLERAVYYYSGGNAWASYDQYLHEYWARYQAAVLHYQSAGLPKMTGHWQTLPGYAAEVQAALGSAWVKIMDPSPGPDPFPGRKKCLRWWTDNFDRLLLAAGEAGAISYMSRMLPRWQTVVNWGEVWFELPNEPECNSDSGLAAVNTFTLKCIELAEGQGLRLCILNLPEGNPHDNGTGDPAVSRWKVQQLAPCVKAAVAGGHLVGLHGYYDPTRSIDPTDRYHALRCKDMVQWWAEAGVDTSRLMLALTEWGIDRSIAGGPARKGWRSAVAETDYLAQLVEAERAFQQLPWLQFAALFDCGALSDWADYDHDKETLLRLAAALKQQAPPAPAQPAEENQTMTIQAFDRNGVAVDLVDLQKRYGFVVKRADAKPGAEVFRITTIREKTGPASLTVHCSKGGAPDRQRRVAFYWPDAPQQTATGHDWWNRYVIGETNENGDVGFGLGTGAYIKDVALGGPHAVWVWSPSTASDCLAGIGMLGGTVHDHVEPEFALVLEPEVIPEPAPSATTPTPESEPAAGISAQELQQARNALAAQVPATMKAADARGYIWRYEMYEPDAAAALAICYDPAAKAYRLLKLSAATWQVIADQPL